ncbi:MAG: AzlD domain-containing protein [Clostridia bacterium]|nr:AzlD domain-containing protein [Clostridia bacterium]
MKNFLVLIIGMTVVTYIPRLIPLAVLSQRNMPQLLRRFLLFIPYTALGALIIPGVAGATPERPIAGIIGIGVGAVLAWRKQTLVVPVLASIATTFLVLCIR